MTKSPVLRFQRPSFPSAVAVEHYFQMARAASWYSNGGPCLETFAARLSDTANCFVAPLASATTALMLGMAAMRRQGNIALLPSFTFPAVAEAARWNGLEPVFLDVSREEWHVSPHEMERGLQQFGGNVALVVAGSSFGTPPPPLTRCAWERVCAAFEVPLLVDSAAGFPGVAQDGLPIGQQGDAEVVSFHITKPFGIGEGGAFCSKDPGLVDRVRRLANFGFDDRRNIVMSSGMNGKLDELHAAVGLAVFDEIAERLERRRSSAMRILAELGGGVQPQLGHELGTYQFLPVLVRDPYQRDEILRVAAPSVELRTYYKPLHLLAEFSECGRIGDLRATEDISARIVSLPIYDDMNSSEERLVSERLRDCTT